MLSCRYASSFHISAAKCSYTRYRLDSKETPSIFKTFGSSANASPSKDFVSFQQLGSPLANAAFRRRDETRKLLIVNTASSSMVHDTGNTKSCCGRIYIFILI